MYTYANRINFERVESIPQFRLVNLAPAEKPLLNNKGQFFVHVNEKTPYLRELVRKAQDLGLTVSGDGTNLVKGGDIRECPKGGLVSFGSSSKFDMNWIKRDEYFTDKKFQPVLNIVEDWDKIDRALTTFAAAKRAKAYRESINTRYHANFCVVDGIVHSYEKNTRVIQIPVKVMPVCPFATQTLEIRILTY
jgi:hypothetical protein